MEEEVKLSNIDADILSEARGGDVTYQLLLGKVYFNEIDVPDNLSVAFEWIRLSAEQGNMEAQFRLGDFYAHGYGAPKSYTDAYKWYILSALQGYRKASIRIHNLYQQDKKIHCRGFLNQEETAWDDINYKKEHKIRELYEYRLQVHDSRLNHIMSYFSDLSITLKSENQSDPMVQMKLGFLYQFGYGVKKYTKWAIEFYSKAAEEGYKDAQYHLGYLYEKSTNIKFNYSLAIRWYRSSATIGNIAAQNGLAYFYEKGLATELNYEGAIYWYTKAANSGNSNAQLTLGRMYRKGQGVEQNLSEAVKWYTLAAKQGVGAAQNCLNQLYQSRNTNQTPDSKPEPVYVIENLTKPTLRSKLQNDIDKIQDHPQINQLKKMVQHAFMTDANAMYQIGMKYYHGQDFSQDKDSSFQWIKKAAKAGLEEAELKLAEMYKSGDVVDQDYHESSVWTIKVARRKNNVGQYKLGLLYKKGHGVRYDPLEASKWLILSSNQGNADALCQFGFLKYHGAGVSEDRYEAIKLFHKTAHIKNADALFRLAVVYEEGKFVEKDVPLAIKLYKLAARIGQRFAAIYLGRIYEQGKLVTQDLAKANEIYQLLINSIDPHPQIGLAQKYQRGVFGEPDYHMALEIYKNVAARNPKTRVDFFQTPIPIVGFISNYADLLNLFIFASKQGETGICYNIGYIYENGIKNFNNKQDVYPNYSDAFYWYFIAAKEGDTRAKYGLGTMYEEGKGVKQDFNAALKYYSEAYSDGCKNATYRLASMYFNGNGIAKDLLKAFHLFNEAKNKGHKETSKYLTPSRLSNNIEMLETVADLGYVAVQYQLGVFYQKQIGSLEKSIHWLTLAAKGGITDAYYRLGILYEKRKVDIQDYSNAIKCYSEAIKNNHEDALFKLAQIYHLGKGVVRNYQKAYELYTRAIELEYNKACKLLDLSSYSPESCSSNTVINTTTSQANELKNTLLMLKDVAKRGNGVLQLKLGDFYFMNKERCNYNEAFKWYQMAASNSCKDAIFKLGLLYEMGLGTVQNYATAVLFYNHAKEKGSRDAIYRLGIAYHYGLGVDANSNKAVHHYIKASELGNDEAQYMLGKLYDSGELTRKNTAKALKWYTKAYLNGNNGVIDHLFHLYDDQSLEYYFYEKLFHILSLLEKSCKSDTQRTLYGLMYYKLGTMYYYGQGTAKNIQKALQQFLLSYYDYGNKDAEPFISLEYDSHKDASQSEYFQKLQTYFHIQNDIPNEHQYKLGMLYYNGVKIISREHEKSMNLTLVDILNPNLTMAYQYFKLASENGFPEAKHQLALMHLRNEEVEKDQEQALKLSKDASELIGMHECYIRGMDFYYGRDVEQNHEIALVYLQRATEGSHHLAQVKMVEINFDKMKGQEKESKAIECIESYFETIGLNDLYTTGTEFYRGHSSIAKNYDLSLFCIQKAADEDDSRAIFQLGIMHLEGKALQENQLFGMDLIEKLIELTNREQCYRQAMRFYNGEYNKNYMIALLYIKTAAERHYGPAQAQYGLLHLQGLGIEKDEKKAMYWFEKSSLQLLPIECYNQGINFYNRVEVDKNYEVALLFFKSSSEKKYYPAQAHLGMMYLQGNGVKKDEEKAMKWIRSSLEGMVPEDCYNQGIKFCTGTDVEIHYDIALLYLHRSADMNYGPAQSQIGLLYFEGKGVPKNRDTGMKWIKESLKNMDPRDCYQYGLDLYYRYDQDIYFEVSSLYMQEAAKKDYSFAFAQLGLIYLLGKGVQKNREKALSYIEIALKKMDLYDCYLEGMKYYDNIEIENDYYISSLYISESAGKKNRYALVQIGITYLEGNGVDKDKNEAMKWFELSIKYMDFEECYNYGMMFYSELHYDIAVFYIKKSASAGYGPAQSQIGVLYLDGKVVEKNKAKSELWITKSINSMIPEQYYNQGCMLYLGTTVMRNYSLSFTYMKKAAENHHGPAQAHLGLVYIQGHGVEKNQEEAQKWIKLSIKELTTVDCYKQGMKYYNGIEVDKDYRIALLYIKEAAERHYSIAQAQLGLMYMEGGEMERNYDIANRWIELSMKEMNLQEYYRVGMMFFHKNEMKNNYEIALHYLLKSSKGYGYAQAQLGYMYLNGVGVAQNHEEAAKWYNQLETTYVGDVRTSRSRIYHYDRDGAQDFSKAFKLYQEDLRINSENGFAYRGIGLLYEYGDGVKQNYEEALKYYKRSFNNSNMAACYNIGLLYYHGRGVKQNYLEAIWWFTQLERDISNDHELHVFIKDGDQSESHEYSLQPFSTLCGEACYFIGLMYLKGYGIDPDQEIAKNYFRIARIHGAERTRISISVS